MMESTKQPLKQCRTWLNKQPWWLRWKEILRKQRDVGCG